MSLNVVSFPVRTYNLAGTFSVQSVDTLIFVRDLFLHKICMRVYS